MTIFVANTSHDKQIKNAFERLYQNRQDEFSDVTLVSEDLHRVPAHGVILSLASPLLASLLLGEASTVVFLPGVKERQLRALVSYIYTGRAELEDGEEETFDRLLIDFKIKNKTDYLSERYFKMLDKDEIHVLPKEEFEIKSSATIIEKISDGHEQNLNIILSQTIDTENDPIVDEIKASPKKNKAIVENETVAYQPLPLMSPLIKPNVKKKIIETRICPFCSTIVKRRQLDSHLIKEHKDLVILCNQCGKSIARAQLRWHTKVAHETVQPKKLCGIEECSFEYNKTDELVKHKRIKHNDRFQCDQCEHSTWVDCELKRHVREKHTSDKYQCEFCSQTFKYTQSLNKHKRVIHEGQRSPCPYCEHQATSAYNLQVHIEAIHELKRFKCEICSISYSKSAQLTSHMKKKHV